MNPNLTRHDVRQLQRRVQAMIQRGTVKTVDDALKMQLLDLDMHAGFAPTKVEHWHPYGFTMVPHAGAEVLASALGGNQDHMVIFGTADRRYRLIGLAGGEVAVHDDQGQKVHFKRDGIHVLSTKPVTIEAPNIHLKGAVQVTGNITQQGGITSTGAHQASAHT
jgi:phage baseplate assembly protein V